MSKILNLCEVLILIQEQQGLNNFLVHEMSKHNDIDEIYIGSYFCEKYFLHLDSNLLLQVNDICNILNTRLSIVIPMASQSDLELVKNHIELIVETIGHKIESMVVNDYGMLEYINNKYKYPIVMGRLLYKQLRDSRYDIFQNDKILFAVHSDYMQQIVKEFNIKAIELEAISEKSNFEKQKEYKVYSHSPLIYITTGKVCEYASCGKSDTKKFRPNAACTHQCNSYFTEYVGVNNKKYYKIGRTVYYFDNIDNFNINTDKIVYFPFEGVRNCYENFGAFE